MNILFLDDDPIRHTRFMAMHLGVDVTQVENAPDAIKALARMRFDEIWLDHDLGGVKSQMTLPLPGFGSGYDVALYIEERCRAGDFGPSKVYLHSYNPTGVSRMRAALYHGDRKGLISVIVEPFNF